MKTWARDHVGVVGVQPELVQRVRAVSAGSSQIALPSLLPNLVPSLLVISGVPMAWTLTCLDAADQVGAAGEVAPLVAAAGLEHAAVVAVELQEVHALQDLVAELGVADALVGVEARATASFLSMVPTRKCLPMSRRKSMAERGAVQSRLLTRRAGLSPSKLRKRETCACR